MELTKKAKTIKYCVYCGIIAVFALIQNVSGLWLEIEGARCFFLIPIAVLISIGEDEKIAALLGLFAGVLWDVVSSTPRCFNAAFIMIVCYLLSILLSHLLRATYLVGVVSSIIATFVYVVVYWFIYVLLKGGTGAGDSFWYFYFPSFIYTSVVAFILNLILIPVKKKLNGE